MKITSPPPIKLSRITQRISKFFRFWRLMFVRILGLNIDHFPRKMPCFYNIPYWNLFRECPLKNYENSERAGIVMVGFSEGGSRSGRVFKNLLFWKTSENRFDRLTTYILWQWIFEEFSTNKQGFLDVNIIFVHETEWSTFWWKNSAFFHLLQN